MQQRPFFRVITFLFFSSFTSSLPLTLYYKPLIQSRCSHKKRTRAACTCALVLYGSCSKSYFESLFSRRSRMAAMKSLLFTWRASTPSIKLTRSFVAIPSFNVSKQAPSSWSPKFINSLMPSFSPRLRRAPDHAKMVAMGLVDVSSPFKYL